MTDTYESEMVTLEQSFEPLEFKPDRLGQVCDIVQTAALVVIARRLLRR